MCEGKHGAQFVEWQLEVVEFHGSLHQFQVGHGAVGGLAQSVQYIATAQALECYADALTLLGQFDALLYHVAHLGGQSCQHACAFGHQVTAKHLEHAVELTTTKQPTATGASLLDAVAQRRCLLQLLVYLCHLVGHAFVSLLHLVDGLQIRRAHG